MGTRRALAFVLLAVLGGCGNSRAEELRDEWRRRCDALVPGTTTLREADVALRPIGLGLLDCNDPSDPYAALPQPDVCPYASSRVCIYGSGQCTTDPGTCGPFGACAFRCEVRVAGNGVAGEDLDRSICAREFRPREPCTSVDF
jgi:hypothetical protein